MIELGRLPTLTGVAAPTIRAKAALVRVIRQVAGGAVLRLVAQVDQRTCVDMAIVTGHLRVPAGQLEGEAVVIEIVTIGVHAIVAGETVRAPIDRVRCEECFVHLLMTVRADNRIERRERCRVTVTTQERLTRDL